MAVLSGNAVWLSFLLTALRAGSRLLYGMADSGSMPFTAIYPKNKTSHKATVTIALVTIFMVLLLQNIEIIANRSLPP
ncbi:hypothetical protein [Kaarinaea lacus]